MNRVFISIGVIVLIAAGWLLVSRTGQHQNMLSANKTPEFSLKDYNDKTVSSADFKGKPLVINAWAAWCPFCVEELADFAKAQEEFSAEGGSASGGGEVVIIAINRAESLETAKKFSDQYGVTGRMILLLDPADSFYKSIGGFSMPETIFVDREGNIVDHKRGPMKLDEIRRRIQEIL